MLIVEQFSFYTILSSGRYFIWLMALISYVAVSRTIFKFLLYRIKIIHVKHLVFFFLVFILLMIYDNTFDVLKISFWYTIVSVGHLWHVFFLLWWTYTLRNYFCLVFSYLFKRL